MNKEWFEPEENNLSKFEVEAWLALLELPGENGMDYFAAISAAFRALLAGEEQPQVFVDLSTTPDTTRAVMADANGNVLQEVTIEQLAQLGIVTKPTPPALAVGDVVRLEACPERSTRNNNFFANRTFTIEEIVEKWDVDKPCYWFSSPDSPHGKGVWWPADRVTLIRRAGEAVPVESSKPESYIAQALKDQHAEIERLTAEVDAETTRANDLLEDHANLLEKFERVTSELDAARFQLEASELRATLLEKSYDEQQAAMTEKEGRCMLLQAEVERLQGVTAQYMDTISHLTVTSGNEQFHADEAKKALARMTAERDALQARIDGTRADRKEGA